MTDSKRLSKEKHEIAYVRKLARTWKKNTTPPFLFETYSINWDAANQINRLCKAVLKFAR